MLNVFKSEKNLMEDPTIERENDKVVLFALCSVMFTTTAFLANIAWMVLVVKIVSWAAFFLAIGVLISHWYLPKDEVDKVSIACRIDPPLLYTVTIARVSTMVLLSNIGWLVPAIYVISNAILSINYMILLERKDVEYTRKQELMRKDPLSAIMKALTKRFGQKGYWDVNDYDDKEQK